MISFFVTAQYISLHRTQGMARIPLEAPAPHQVWYISYTRDIKLYSLQAVAISFRCRVKSFMDKFWETHTINLGPLIPLPKVILFYLQNNLIIVITACYKYFTCSSDFDIYIVYKIIFPDLWAPKILSNIETRI